LSVPFMHTFSDFLSWKFEFFNNPLGQVSPGP
jgi:hypothetical protein